MKSVCVVVEELSIEDKNKVLTALKKMEPDAVCIFVANNTHKTYRIGGERRRWIYFSADGDSLDYALSNADIIVDGRELLGV